MGQIAYAHGEIKAAENVNYVMDDNIIKHEGQNLKNVINSAQTSINGKADKSYVNTELAKKASTQAMTAALAEKADNSTVSALQTTVGTKADKTYVDNQLATKASTQAMTSALATKADNTTVSSLADRVSTNETNIATQTARIDNIANLPSGSTSGDAELLDIRVGADSKTYTSAGAAVRSQITDVKSDLSQFERDTITHGVNRFIVGYTEIVNGYLPNATNNNISVSNDFRILKVKVEPSTTYTATHQRHYACFCDDNGNYISSFGEGNKDLYNYTFTTPSNCGYAWLVVTKNENFNAYMVIEGSTMPSTYIKGELYLSDYIRLTGQYTVYCCPDSTYVTYDVSSTLLTIPQNAIFINGKGSAFSRAELNLNTLAPASLHAWVIRYNTDTSSLVVETWNANSKSKYPVFGYVYNSHVFILGCTSENIKITGNSTSAKYDIAIIASNGDYAVYDRTSDTKTVTIPSGFIVRNGVTDARANAVTIDVTSSLGSANACKLWYDKSNQNYFSTSWNSTASSSDQYFIGYLYSNQVYIFGLDSENIIKKNKTVCFFGDSITAGVGTNKPYHVHFSNWGRYYKCLNYGIGSTGYVCTATGSVDAGEGVEGDGHGITASGSNTILEVMQSVETIDYCVIAAGTNDWSANISIDTFRTKVQQTLDYALEHTTTGSVLVLTPVKRNNYASNNSVGKKLHDYSEVIIEECESRGIAYCDGFDVSINPMNSTSKSKFMGDGIHPNDKGQSKLARCYYSKFLEAMCD